MQDDPPEDELDESQSESSDVDDGDAVDISGIEIDVGNTDGGNSNDTPEEDRCLEIGWQRDTYDSDEKLTCHAEGEWTNDVDLGEFLKDVEDDPNAATMLGAANEFDLDAEGSSAEEPAQSLLLGDSLAGDIESIIASDIFVEEGLASVVLETDGSGSLLVQGSGLKENNEKSGIESSGIIDSDPTIEGSDVGSLSGKAGGPFGIDYAKMTFWEFFIGVDDVKAWDVDLGEFLKDVEDDPNATVTPQTVKNFYLDSLNFLFKQPASIIVAGLAVVCFLVVVVSLILLISMFLGYV